MRTSRRHRSPAAAALLLALMLLAALAPAALAASSIEVGMPRKIGVQQPFTLTVSGFGDQAPLNRPDAKFRVVVFGRSVGYPLDTLTCRNPPATAVGNPGVGFLMVSEYVPAGAVSLSYANFKMPQVGNWTICAAISGYNVGGPNSSALALPAAKVTVVQGHVKLDETAVDVSFAPGQLVAGGLGISLASILATKNGQGIANHGLSIQPDPKPGAARAVVCDTRSGGALLWPTHRFSDGTRSTTGFDTRTDAGGEKQLKVLTGSQAGTFSLSATLKGQTSIFDIKELALTAAGTGRDPAAVEELLTRAGRDFMEGASPRFAAAVGLRQGQQGSALSRQQALLEFLAAVRAGSGTLNGLAFGPIRSADGRAGILLYPQGSIVRTPSGAITPGLGSSRTVIDVEGLAAAIGSSQTVGGIFRFPDLTLPGNAGAVRPLATWQAAGPAATGPAVVGFATPQKNEDLAYFGYPEPPALGQPGRNEFNGCLDLGLGDFIAEIHSPLRASFTAADGSTLGLTKDGPVLDIPGGFISAPRGGVARYGIPAGAATWLRLTGTGKGGATVVVTGPRGGTPSVFTFGVKDGQSGSLKLSGSSVPGSLTFAGKKVRAGRGVGLKLTAPKKAGKGKSFTVVVKDQFGRAVGGVTVSAGGAVRVTDRKGRAKLKAPKRGGGLKVSATAEGYRKASKTVRVG